MDAFHCYDPEYGGNGIFEICDTLEAAIEACNEDIKSGWTPDAGDEWSLDVTSIAVFKAPRNCDDPCEDGEMVARASEVDVVRRPDDVDEHGFSQETGDYWGNGYEYVCNYAVKPVPRPTSEQAP